jgi:hypothetical protein
MQEIKAIAKNALKTVKIRVMKLGQGVNKKIGPATWAGHLFCF